MKSPGERRSRFGAAGWGISLLLHATLFLTAGFLLVQPPLFGVQEAPSSAEVELIASTETPLPPTEHPVETPLSPIPEPTPVVQEVQQPPPDEMALPEPTPQPAPPAPPTPPPPRPKKPSSKPLSQKSQAPSSSMKGARQAQPDYLRNPPPVYPDSARSAHQQGVVLLMVQVSAKGEAEHVSLHQSSGYPELDQSALRAVREWRFRPASVAGMDVPSTVGVPVRFELH